VFTLDMADMMAVLFGAAADEDYYDEELESYYYHQAAGGGYQATGSYQAQSGGYQAAGGYRAAAGGGTVPRVPTAAGPPSSLGTRGAASAPQPGAAAGQQSGTNTASGSSHAEPGRIATATATATPPLASNSASSSSGAASRPQAAAAHAEAPAGSVDGEKTHLAGPSLTAEEELQHLRTCVVCMSVPRSVLLLPCKHLVLCQGCSDHLQGQAWQAWLVAGGMARSYRGAGEGGRPREGAAQAQCPVCRQAAEQHVGGVIMA
jgi:hypothetical protein